MIYKGMILAAGLGTRMRPLTDHLPKPLLDFHKSSPLEIALKQFKHFGIQNVAVNTHHLPNTIEQFLKDHPEWKDVYLSKELPEILGSGGAFPKISKWRNGSPLIVYNGDVVSNIDISKVISVHEKNNALVTMTLLPKPFERDKKVFVEGELVKLIDFDKPKDKNWKTCSNAGLFIYSDRFLNSLPDSGSFGITPLIEKAISQNEIVAAYIHNGFWHAFDSLDLYKKAQEDFLKERPKGIL